MSNITVDEFVLICNVPAVWEQCLRLEVLGGCSQCGRRLVSTNNHGSYVHNDVTVLRVADPVDGLVAVYVLCDKCHKESACLP